MKSLDTLRKEINFIDDAIVELFLKRIAVSKEIALYKEKNGLPIFDAQRELDNIHRIKMLFEQDAIWALFEPLYQMYMDISKKVQKL